LSTGRGDPEGVRGARCGGIHPDLPTALGEDHEKYSTEVSAATKYSWKAALEGGGFAATKVNFRWSMILSTTEKSVMKVGQEALEMVEQHSVEDGPLRIPGTIDSRPGARRASRNGPSPRIGPRLPERTGRVPARKGESSP